MMVEIHNPLTCQPLVVERVIGQHQSKEPGPFLLVLAGIHGNEPSGVIALDNVLKSLRDQKQTFCGTLLGIAGNLAALQADVRYLDVDLNRLWTPDRIAGFRQGKAPENAEEAELAEVVQAIHQASDGLQRKFFLDCHTTSSESVPFISLRATIDNVHLASQFPVHAILGAGTHLSGISDAYLVQQGFTGFTFEAGQHDELASIEAQEAMIWLMLERSGCIDVAPRSAKSRLAKTQIDGCHHFEIDHIHRTAPDGGFRMAPGFFNFKRIRPGELLAWEHNEPIYSQWDGYIFMPLYQPLGDEGFSIIHPLE